MRKLLAALLAATLLLSACGRQRAASSSASSSSSGSASSEPVPEATAEQLCAAILASQEDLPALTAFKPGDSVYTDYLQHYYELSPDDIPDAVICIAQGAGAMEVAVLKLKDASGVTGAEDALQSYRVRRAGDFTGYAPEEAALVENGLVASSGSCLALLLCPDPEKGREAFLDCIRGKLPEVSLTDLLNREPPEQPDVSAPDTSVPDTSVPDTSIPDTSGSQPSAPSEERHPSATVPVPSHQDTPPAQPESPAPQEPVTPDPQEPIQEPVQEPVSTLPDEYREEDVKQAYATGDTSRLTPKNLAVLNKCQEVLRNLTTLSPYDQELAVHDWIIRWGEYDSNTLTHDPNFTPSPDNDNPYGFLTYGRGICLGYTTTFQLFMDLLGIECITVHGTAYSATEEHAWNMVKLDGAWYCVDCTWDDPISRVPVSTATAHQYFNCTSEYLKQTDHQWDAGAVPEASATEWAWLG